MTVSRVRILIAAACLAFGGITVAALEFARADGENRFAPPRTAVVDVAQIFEGYAKKTEIEKKIEAEVEEGRKKLQEKDEIDAFTAKIEEKKAFALQSIRKDIQEAIEAFGKEKALDLIIEKNVSAGNVHWPIVHHVKPSLDITGEVLRRLNAAKKIGTR